MPGRRLIGDPPGKRKALKAAKVLFARRGYQNTTTKEIAALAGISPATIFKYYESKEALLRAIVDDLAETSKTDFFLRVQAVDSLEELTHLVVADRLAFFEHHQLEIMIIVQEYLVGNPGLFNLDELVVFANYSFNQAVNRIRRHPTRLNPTCSAVDVMRTIVGFISTYLLQQVYLPGAPRPTPAVLEEQILRSLTVDS